MFEYQTSQLRSLVESIHTGKGGLKNRLDLRQFSWDSIASKIIVMNDESDARLLETKKLFGVLWTRLAADLLDRTHIDEYNSIKHGFRAALGGSQLFAGVEDIPGIAAAPEKMKHIGGSIYGTSFFCPEAPIDFAGAKGDPNFRIRSTSVNWNPKAMALRLQLIAMSISNIVSFAKIVNGVDPNTVRFVRCQEASDFDRPWEYPVGVTSINIDTQIASADIRPMTKESILSSYDSDSQK